MMEIDQKISMSCWVSLIVLILELKRKKKKSGGEWFTRRIRLGAIIGVLMFELQFRQFDSRVNQKALGFQFGPLKY